jgi:hypothetical protein
MVFAQNSHFPPQSGIVASFPGKVITFRGSVIIFPVKVVTFPGSVVIFPVRVTIFPFQVGAFRSGFASIPDRENGNLTTKTRNLGMGSDNLAYRTDNRTTRVLNLNPGKGNLPPANDNFAIG